MFNISKNLSKIRIVTNPYIAHCHYKGSKAINCAGPGCLACNHQPYRQMIKCGALDRVDNSYKILIGDMQGFRDLAAIFGPLGEKFKDYDVAISENFELSLDQKIPLTQADLALIPQDAEQQLLTECQPSTAEEIQQFIDLGPVCLDCEEFCLQQCQNRK